MPDALWLKYWAHARLLGLSEDEFWKSTAAKIDALDKIKYPRAKESVYYTQEDGPNKADTGASDDGLREGMTAFTNRGRNA